MKKPLEDFIRENREAFDDQTPTDRVWMKISQAIFPSKLWWNSVMIWRAAAVLFMGLSVYLIIPKVTSEKKDQIVMSEFKAVEDFYVKQISEKVEMIHEYRGVEKGLNGFTHDFQQLEAMYYVLKEEMKERPSKQVKDALVLNLLVRIDLLNLQLQEIEESKESNEYQENEKKDRDIAA
jgi:hypothetical protein